MAKKETPKEEEFGEEVDDTIMDPDGEIGAELTEEEKKKLEADARKEVAAALKAVKMKDFKSAAKKRLQAQAMFTSGKDDTGEDLDEVDLALASHPKYIMLDGAVYHSGRKYKKRKAVIAVLKDQMDRGWRQEAARMGERTEWVEQKQKLLTRGGLQMH